MLCRALFLRERGQIKKVATNFRLKVSRFVGKGPKIKVTSLIFSLPRERSIVDDLLAKPLKRGLLGIVEKASIGSHGMGKDDKVTATLSSRSNSASQKD